MNPYQKYTDATLFDDETTAVHCRDCGEEEDLDFVNVQCGNCGGGSIAASTVLEEESCKICDREFEEYDPAWYSRSQQAYICDDCHFEHVRPLIQK